MSTARQRIFTQEVCKDTELWNEAITDGERLINKAKERIRELRTAIRVCKNKRDNGEAFPGMSVTQSKPKATSGGRRVHRNSKGATEPAIQ